jgi:hypothetical protein
MDCWEAPFIQALHHQKYWSRNNRSVTPTPSLG